MEWTKQSRFWTSPLMCYGPPATGMNCNWILFFRPLRLRISFSSMSELFCYWTWSLYDSNGNLNILMVWVKMGKLNISYRAHELWFAKCSIFFWLILRTYMIKCSHLFSGETVDCWHCCFFFLALFDDYFIQKYGHNPFVYTKQRVIWGSVAFLLFQCVFTFFWIQRELQQYKQF